MSLRLEKVEQELRKMSPSVEELLRLRGKRRISHSSLAGVALPAVRDEKTLNEYYQSMKSYYFRRLLAELIERKHISHEEFLHMEQEWGSSAWQKYSERLKSWGILKEEPGRETSYEFYDPTIRNFGKTLEWLVAQVFQRELSAPSIWHVRIDNSRKGGDFDVFARIGWFLGYVECKSSPPYNVRLDEQREFIERLGDLEPHFAILLIDTTLNIKRNIIDNMQFLLGRKEKITVLRGEVYRTPSNIYIMTSKRSLIRNISLCVEDFMSHWK